MSSPSGGRPYAACLPQTGSSRLANSKNRHHLRNSQGEIEILSTAEVVAHAREILQLVDFPPNDVEALAKGYVEVLNSAYPDYEAGLSGRAAGAIVGHLVGYAYMLSQVRMEEGGRL